MKNSILNLVSGILLLFFGFCIGIAYSIPPREPIVKLVPVQCDIPSVMQIQQSLKDLDNPRYDPGVVDGIPGKKTVTGWNNYTKDQFAKKEIEQ